MTRPSAAAPSCCKVTAFPARVMVMLGLLGSSGAMLGSLIDGAYSGTCITPADAAVGGGACVGSAGAAAGGGGRSGSMSSCVDTHFLYPRRAPRGVWTVSPYSSSEPTLFLSLSLSLSLSLCVCVCVCVCVCSPPPLLVSKLGPTPARAAAYLYGGVR
eukprot:COSAG02_NODE_4120_length_5748_cov_5.310320_4_plen_158_part_00